MAPEPSFAATQPKGRTSDITASANSMFDIAQLVSVPATYYSQKQSI
jgi:hypothetical protein